VAVSTGDDTSSSEHVDNQRQEKPPITLLVVFVEYAVLSPDLFVFIQGRRIAFHALELVSNIPDFPGKEAEDSGEDGKCDTSKNLGRPRIAILELIDAIKGPDTVEEQNQVGDCFGKSPPVSFPEASQTLREVSA